MFTGLILGMGDVTRVTPGTEEARFTIRALFPAPAWVTGESISVNGVCLSVETFDAVGFTAYASQETLRISNLKHLRSGSRVNLERALSLGDRLGGHMVSGHVDGIARVTSITSAGSSLRIRAHFPAEFAAQVIPKGSVALDGVSLTVNACGPDFLEVNVIPETQRSTTIAGWKVAQELNFETDLIGKYVQRMLGAYQAPHQGTGPDAATFPARSGGLTLDMLRENGF